MGDVTITPFYVKLRLPELCRDLTSIPLCRLYGWGNVVIF